MKAQRRYILPAVIILTVLFSGIGLDSVSAAKLGKRPGRTKKRIVKSPTISPRDAAVYKQLGRTVNLSAWTIDTPFSEAIEFLRNSVEPDLKIIVLWSQLESEAFVGPDTPIYLDDIPAMPLARGLEFLLMSVSQPGVRLNYHVEYGTIIIATKDYLRERRLVTQVYNVSELTMLASGGFTAGSQGTVGRMDQNQQSVSAEDLAELIRETIEPESWEDAGEY